MWFWNKTPKRKYGWTPASPELQARVHAELGVSTFRLAPPVTLPPAFEIPATGPVLDQGQLGSCGPNATASLLRSPLSRLFVYYQTRALMGTVNQDSGVVNSLLVKAVAQSGYPDETLWPYSPRYFRSRPSAAAYVQARTRVGRRFVPVPVGVVGIKAALSRGNPVLVGVNVYESFESQTVARTGDVPMPGAWDQMLGGHDIVLVGWNDATQRFKFKNSYGAAWGDKGYGTFPYAYVTTLGSDYWTVV